MSEEIDGLYKWTAVYYDRGTQKWNGAGDYVRANSQEEANEIVRQIFRESNVVDADIRVVETPMAEAVCAVTKAGKADDLLWKWTVFAKSTDDRVGLLCDYAVAHSEEECRKLVFDYLKRSNTMSKDTKIHIEVAKGVPRAEVMERIRRSGRKRRQRTQAEVVEE